MIFSSFEFIFVFLPFSFIGYFLFSKKSARAGNIFLLFASLFFYAWTSLKFVPLIAASVLFNYFWSRAILKSSKSVWKKIFLTFGIAVDIGLLCYFKYTNFFIQISDRFLKTEWNFLNIALPPGISFWTFQQIAYLVDSYRGETEKNSFLDFSLLVTIFPHLVSGPIFEQKQIIPQFSDEERHKINYQNISEGIVLFSFGLFKKVAVADKLSPFVAEIFAKSGNLLMVEAWAGVLAYAFQLYFDFSSYSEMAVGIGKMFNFDFPRNFDSPYQSSSIIDFWKRWHITLGNWIKNYLYIPLGGNRKGTRRKYFNLFAAMTICGIWHGAGFRFLFWGMMHGFFLVVNHGWRKFSKEHNLVCPKIAGVFLTFVSVSCGWAVFRAGSLKSGLKIIKAMFNFKSLRLPSGGKIENLLAFLKYFFSGAFRQMDTAFYPFLLLLCVIVFCLPNAQKIVEKKFVCSWKWLFAVCAALLYSFYLMLGNQNLSEFLYFQF